MSSPRRPDPSDPAGHPSPTAAGPAPRPPQPAAPPPGAGEAEVSDARRFAAEFLGTAILVIGGVGTAVFAGHAVGDLGVALAFGLILLAMAYAIGPLSGCHINPAVTLGLFVAAKIGARHAAGYVLAQLAGAIVGAAFLLAVVSTRPGYSLAGDGLGANGYGDASTDHYPVSGVWGIEIVLTFVLVFVVLAATDRIANAANAGLPIGLTLAVLHLIAIPIDGTSVNPARSLGPALMSGATALGQLPVFLIAPLVGAAIAALAYRALFSNASAVKIVSSAVTPESMV